MSNQSSKPSPTRHLTISLPGDRPNYAFAGDTYSIIMPGSATQNSYACIEMYVPPNSGPLPHSHEFEEMFYVLEGQVEVFCHDQRTTAHAFSAVNIPGWAPHMFKNLSDRPARMLCVVAPAGLDAQFAELGKEVATPTTPGPPPGPAELASLQKNLPAILERYHGRVENPDLFNRLLTPAEFAKLK
jgi:mannose-6-phosphate isomerase-like protein (cupin superfamily)